MDSYDEQPRSIVLAEILNKAFGIYKENFQFFISVSLIYALLAELGGVMLTKFNLAESNKLVFYKAVINILIASWASIAIIFAASKLVIKKKFSSQIAFVVARKKYAIYLAVYLMVLLIVISGFLLFIIPGLYFLTIFLFADILVVIENVKFQQAFRHSARMIRPFFWKVFSYIFLIVGISLVPEVVYQLGAGFNPGLAGGLQKVVAVLIMPYLMIAQVVLYQQIKEQTQVDLTSLEDQVDSMISDE